MDLTNLKSVIQTHLSNASGLYSLQLQNHIYGCFILLEDIAQGNFKLKDNLLIHSTFTFDLNLYFSQIGIRYGFLMDTKLVLETCPDSYKEIWLETFKDISLAKDLELVDSLEDELLRILHENVKEDEAFFIQASQTGHLPQEWINKVLLLIQPSLVPQKVIEVSETTKKSLLSQANPETKVISTKHRRLAITRRHKPSDSGLRKKSLAKTRRSK
jgi:hypothetical protein